MKNLVNKTWSLSYSFSPIITHQLLNEETGHLSVAVKYKSRVNGDQCSKIADKRSWQDDSHAPRSVVGGFISKA